ncbi:MAG: ABC transporter substrate-binding protein, partial [Pseudobdellovibrionaceae bacterium]
MIRIAAAALSLVLLTASNGALALGNTEAPQGGTINIHLLAEPPTIHPISAVDQYAQNIHTFTMGTLLTKNWETYEWKPFLAEKWEVSKDGKVFTFWLRKNLTFHDGKPLTADDVKFSFDAIMDPKYSGAHRRPYLEGISKVEVIDPHQVKFYTKDTYFQNFDIVVGMMIIPKHIYSDLEKSRKMTKELVGSGPYKVEKFEKGQRIVLKKYPQFFAKEVPEFKGTYNFGSIVFKFIRDENVYLDQLAKGELDYAELSPEQYMKKTEGGNWGKSILKVKAENKVGKNYRYIGWNLEQPMFKEREVR